MLSNRVLVVLGLWPFGTVNVWLGPIMLAAVGAGFALGLVSHLPHHFSLHRRARNAEKRVAQLSGTEGSGKPGP